MTVEWSGQQALADYENLTLKTFHQRLPVLGIVMDTKLNMTQHELLMLKEASGIRNHNRLPASHNRSSIHSTDEDAPGILHPVLGSLVQERHGAAGKSNKGPQR